MQRTFVIKKNLFWNSQISVNEWKFPKSIFFTSKHPKVGSRLKNQKFCYVIILTIGLKSPVAKRFSNFNCCKFSKLSHQFNDICVSVQTTEKLLWIRSKWEKKLEIIVKSPTGLFYKLYNTIQHEEWMDIKIN